MERGAAAAKALLADIRACGELAAKSGFPVRICVLAGLIEAALPGQGPGRIEFLLILAQFLAGALAGCPPDLDELDLPAAEDPPYGIFPHGIAVNE